MTDKQTTDRIQVRKLLDYLVGIKFQDNMFETVPRLPPFHVVRIGRTIIGMWHVGDGVYDVTATSRTV